MNDFVEFSPHSVDHNALYFLKGVAMLPRFLKHFLLSFLKYVCACILPCIFNHLFHLEMKHIYRICKYACLDICGCFLVISRLFVNVMLLKSWECTSHNKPLWIWALSKLYKITPTQVTTGMFQHEAKTKSTCQQPFCLTKNPQPLICPLKNNHWKFAKKSPFCLIKTSKASNWEKIIFCVQCSWQQMQYKREPNLVTNSASKAKVEEGRTNWKKLWALRA